MASTISQESVAQADTITSRRPCAKAALYSSTSCSTSKPQTPTQTIATQADGEEEEEEDQEVDGCIEFLRLLIQVNTHLYREAVAGRSVDAGSQCLGNKLHLPPSHLSCLRFVHSLDSLGWQ